jgi:putative chitinase
MSRNAFYESVAGDLFKGSLPSWQSEPLGRLIDEGLARDRAVQDTAYVLATAYHETARFKYMEEIGEGDGRDYGEPLLLIRGKLAKYHGRGFVQLTWLANYAKMSGYLGIDLVNEPDKAKDPTIAAKVIWEGMIRGHFTGKNLADYINGDEVDYVGARRIVNGTDKAEMIAGYARTFEDALALMGDAPSVAGCDRTGCPLSEGS